MCIATGVVLVGVISRWVVDLLDHFTLNYPTPLVSVFLVTSSLPSVYCCNYIYIYTYIYIFLYRYLLPHTFTYLLPHMITLDNTY